MSYTEKTRSNAWFLLPVLFGIIGGVAAYFILRQDDPQKAKNCLYMGVIFMVLGIAVNAIILDQVPEISSGIDIGV